MKNQKGKRATVDQIQKLREWLNVNFSNDLKDQRSLLFATHKDINKDIKSAKIE